MLESIAEYMKQLDVPGVVSLMQKMLTPESYKRWREQFPDSRIKEFIEEYADYDKAWGWEEEVREDPDNQKYVVSEDYWKKYLESEPRDAEVRHGYSDDDFIIGYPPEPEELGKWDLEPEFYNNSLDSSTVQNAYIEQTPQGTWIVRGDSERFGKNAILYEDHKKQKAASYLHKLNKSESAKNMAKSRYKADLNSGTDTNVGMRVRASVNCARHQHAITCLNCAVSEVTVPTDFVRTESRAFDLMMIVQDELWDRGMDVTIKQLYRPQTDTFRFSYVITDPTTTDEQVDAAIEEIVAKLVQTGFSLAEAFDDPGLNSSESGQETTEISINLFDAFPSTELWECMNWLEHEMWAEGWDASIESADQPKPDQIALTVSHPSNISGEDIDDFIKDRVLEFIENGYERFVYPETDPRSRYNASLSCSADWISGDGNAFYLVDDGEDDGWGDPDKYDDYKVETDEYGNDVVHYEGYVITGNERIGYVALSPYGTWSPTIYRSITDAVDDVDRDIAAKSQARA